VIGVRGLISVAALALCAALTAWWLAQPPGAVDGARLAKPAAQSERDGALIDELQPNRVEEQAAAQREAVALSPSEMIPATLGEPALRGRVVVVESNGYERWDADGRLNWMALTEEGGKFRSTDVTDGTWTLRASELAPFEAISFDSVAVDDRVAYVEQSEPRLERPFEQDAVVRARIPDPAVLRVVDAATNRDLDRVMFVAGPGLFDADVRHPGNKYEARVLARDLRSPIELDRSLLAGSSHSTGFFVGAAGYTWELVEIEERHGGERLVALALAADLTLDVRGVHSKDHAHLSVVGADRTLWAGAALNSDGPFELRGLAPGSYRAIAGVGNGRIAPLVLGEVPLELRAGEVTHAVLALAEAPAVELAAASGAVHIPSSWGVDSARLSLAFRDPALEGRQTHRVFEASAAPAERDGFDTFRWSQDELQVGGYELELHDPSFLIAFELPRGGRSDIEFTLPPPAELAVHVVDDATGAPASTEALFWRPIWAEGVGDGGVESARQVAAGEYRIRAPRTELVMNVCSRKFQPRSLRVDLREETELTMRLTRGCGFELTLLDGTTPVSFPRTWGPQPKHQGGNGFRSFIEREPFRLTVMTTQPGTYTLELPAISGYEPIPTQTIEITAGHYTEHVVQLVRMQ